MKSRLGINLTSIALGLTIGIPAFAQNKPPASQSMHRPGVAAENPANHADQGVQIAVKGYDHHCESEGRTSPRQRSQDNIHVSTVAGVVSLKGGVPTRQAAVRAE